MSDEAILVEEAPRLGVPRGPARNRFSERIRVVAPLPIEGKGAKQSFKDECDINKIMAKFVKTGMITHVNRFEGSYGEVPSQTYHEAMEVVREANEMFMEVPAAIRQKFGNSPAAFLDFVNDPNNVDEMRKLGMVKPIPEKIVSPIEALGDRIAELVSAAKPAAQLPT